MNIQYELIKLRKSTGLTQEQFSEKLDVSRQAVAKWENGSSIPEIEKLILISKMYNITLDRLIKGKTDCSKVDNMKDFDILDLTGFLCRAKINTYAGRGAEANSSRIKSHDLEYSEGNMKYLDSYFGSKKFIGEETMWKSDIPLWSMNYMGRVLSQSFSGDFLKECLIKVPIEYPYRGPKLYTKNDHTYHCNVKGDFSWFYGTEEIFYLSDKVYECTFHGGKIL